MADQYEQHFEWDQTKAASNRRKHGISFEQAATVFNDPLMLSIPDDEHSQAEQRWITMGQVNNGKLLVVIHTYQQIDNQSANIRIISARPATRHEHRQYEN